jgi:HAD superfamily hydrolase (TIGR01509 family)
MTAELLLADRLLIPAKTAAILFDMDGVLIDSIQLDYEVCQGLLNSHIGTAGEITKSLIRRGFALSPPDFWRFLLTELQVKYSEEHYNNIVAAFLEERRSATYSLNKGIIEIISAAREKELKLAVVSNNTSDDIVKILGHLGVLNLFSLIQGNEDSLRKKPSPDTYIRAAERLAVALEHCLVVEDSVLGAEAGARSGAFTVGVATGGDFLDDLAASGYPNVCYKAFEPISIEIGSDSVLKKSISTPNEFVSHMIEHVAWRLGVSINVSWNNDDWGALGKMLGLRLSQFTTFSGDTAVLGMIDDGSCEMAVSITGNGQVSWESVNEFAVDDFLCLRCEQLNSGAPLKQMLDGLAESLGANIIARICSLEDPHHTWEGVFRAFGISLGRLRTGSPTYEIAPLPHECRASSDYEGSTKPTSRQGSGSLTISTATTSACCVERVTAESAISVSVFVTGSPEVSASFKTSDTIDVSSFPEMLRLFGEAAGISIDAKFAATRISSSHVVLEDTGLVLGTAIYKVLEARMNAIGVNGAGSSLFTKSDFSSAPVAAAVSFEGRKFLKLLPFDISQIEFRRKFQLGVNTWGGLRSEDLDDFLDALAAGMRASIIIHFRSCRSLRPHTLWSDAIYALGVAVREAFAWNPLRKGLPPGVKATLL